MNTEVFHSGEQALQQATGMRERMSSTGPKVIRTYMPDTHRELFEKLPLIFVGALDQDSRPWATVRVGAPGFVKTPNNTHLEIFANYLPGDPLEGHLQKGASVGLLGVEFATRRRNRMNGIIQHLDSQKLTVKVQQSFGNCPKYIQTRFLDSLVAPSESPTVLYFSHKLPEAAQHLIRQADSFYIASAFNQPKQTSEDTLSLLNQGVDISHRGGKPGFIKLTVNKNQHTLDIPDYLGNFFFNTLGNLHLNPQAGLLFLDYTCGDMLYIHGHTEIQWSKKSKQESHLHTERTLRFTVQSGRWVSGAFPSRWCFGEYSTALE